MTEDLLKRKFDLDALNTVWCGDMTYIKVGKRGTYFAAVLDFFARKIVGWSFLMTPDASLTCEALRMAVELRGRPKDVMFHSHYGCVDQHSYVMRYTTAGPTVTTTTGHW